MLTKLIEESEQGKKFLQFFDFCAQFVKKIRHKIQSYKCPKHGVLKQTGEKAQDTLNW